MADLRHLIAGGWRAGTGSALQSVNPTRPTEIVAEGNSAVAADVDDAVAAAQSALPGWTATPMHSRGAILAAAADPHVPFGGAKKSGLGPKEQGGASREFFTDTTTVYLRGGATGP